MNNREIESRLNEYFKFEEKNFEVPKKEEIKVLNVKVALVPQKRRFRLRYTAMIAACLSVMLCIILISSAFRTTDGTADSKIDLTSDDVSSSKPVQSIISEIGDDTDRTKIKETYGIANWYEPGVLNVQTLKLTNSKIENKDSKVNPFLASKNSESTNTMSIVEADLPSWVSNTKMLSERYVQLYGSEMVYPNIYGGGTVVYDIEDDEVFSVQQSVYQFDKEYIHQAALDQDPINIIDITEYGTNPEWCMYIVNGEAQKESAIWGYQERYFMNIRTGEKIKLSEGYTGEYSICISADYKYILIRKDNAIYLLDRETMEKTTIEVPERLAIDDQGFFTEDNKYLFIGWTNRDEDWAVYDIENKTYNYGHGRIIRFTDSGSSIQVETDNGIKIFRISDMEDITDSYELEEYEKYEVMIEVDKNTSKHKLILRSLYGDEEDVTIADWIEGYVEWNGYYYIYQSQAYELLVYSVEHNELFRYDIQELGLHERDFDKISIFISDSGRTCNLVTFKHETLCGNIYYELPPDIREIELPKNGETIKYPMGFVMFESPDKKYKLTLTEAYRSGDNIYFNAVEEEYMFEGLGLSIYTSDREVFVGLNVVSDENIPYDYVITQQYDENLKIHTLNEFLLCLGKDFEWDKNYFNIHIFIEEWLIYPVKD